MKTMKERDEALKKEFSNAKAALTELRKDSLIQLLEQGMTRELFAHSMVVPTYFRGLSSFKSSWIKEKLFDVWGGVSY